MQLGQLLLLSAKQLNSLPVNISYLQEDSLVKAVGDIYTNLYLKVIP